MENKYIEKLIENPKSYKNIYDPSYNLSLNAVRLRGNNLKYVPLNYLDEEICLEAVKKNSDSIVYVPKKIITQTISDFAIKNGNNLKYIPKKYKNFLLCRKSIENGCDDFRLIPRNFILDNTIDYLNDNNILETLVIAFIEKFGTLFTVPFDLLNTKICFFALSKNFKNIGLIPENLKNKKFYIKLLKYGSIPLCDIPKNLLDCELCIKYVKNNTSNIIYVPEKFKTKEMCDLVINKTPKYLFSCISEHIPKKFFS